MQQLPVAPRPHHRPRGVDLRQADVTLAAPLQPPSPLGPPLCLLCSMPVCYLGYPPEEGKIVVLELGLLLAIVAVIIFYISWIIYGIVLFFPAASSHPCRALSIVSSTCKLANQVLNSDPFYFLLLQVGALIVELEIVDTVLFCKTFCISSAADTVLDNEVTSLQFVTGNLANVIFDSIAWSRPGQPGEPSCQGCQC